MAPAASAPGRQNRDEDLPAFNSSSVMSGRSRLRFSRASSSRRIGFGSNLSGSLVEILDALPTDQSTTSNQVWQGHIVQPATSASSFREPAQARRGRDCCDHRSGVDRTPVLAGSVLAMTSSTMLRAMPRMNDPTIVGGNPRWITRLDSQPGVAGHAEWLNGRHPGFPGGRRGRCQPTPGGLWPRDDGCGPRASGRTDGEDHAAESLQGGRNLERVRRRSRDSLCRGPWRTRHQYELQRRLPDAAINAACRGSLVASA